jgi:hypothetical protein
MTLRSLDFESSASADSATPACPPELPPGVITIIDRNLKFRLGLPEAHPGGERVEL